VEALHLVKVVRLLKLDLERAFGSAVLAPTKFNSDLPEVYRRSRYGHAQ
jgi:hypothetical protein